MVKRRDRHPGRQDGEIIKRSNNERESCMNTKGERNSESISDRSKHRIIVVGVLSKMNWDVSCERTQYENRVYGKSSADIICIVVGVVDINKFALPLSLPFFITRKF